MFALWRLIEIKSKEVALCHELLDLMTAMDPDGGEPITPIIEHILNVELDHIQALKRLYEATNKSKATTDVSELARHAIADYRERKKIIK